MIANSAIAAYHHETLNHVCCLVVFYYQYQKNQNGQAVKIHNIILLTSVEKNLIKILVQTSFINSSFIGRGPQKCDLVYGQLIKFLLV